jgi:MFS family permease
VDRGPAGGDAMAVLSDPAAGGVRGFRPSALGDQIRLAFLWFCGNALWEALPTVVLPFLVLRDVGNAHKAAALSLLTLLGTILASVVHPLGGWASDVVHAGFGRRRLFVLGGGLLAAAGILWIGLGRGFPQLVAAVLIVQFGYNAALAGYQAYIPELAPARRRGEASGFLGLMSTSGALIGAFGAALLLRGATYPYLLAGLAALLLAGVAVTVWGLPEPPPAAPPPSGGAAAAADKPAYRDFGWVVATRGLVMVSFYSLLTYLAYYMRDVEGFHDYAAVTSYVVALTIAAAAASTLWAGRRSDRVGRRAIVSLAGALMGLGALAFLLVRGLPGVLALGLVFGMGYGAYVSVDWALVTDVLPDPRTIARDMGIWGMAITVPQVLAPLLGGAIFLLLPTSPVAYEVLFGCTSLFALAGSLLVWRVQGVR